MEDSKLKNNQYPNILWIITDEQRTDSLGCYNSSWAKTPYLDKFAREGVIFRNAVTPAPVCVPARASLITGQYPSRTGIWWNHNGRDKRKLDHLTYRFAEAGYATASFGKQHYASPNKAFQTEFHREVNEIVDFFSYGKQYNAEKFNIVQYPPKPYAWILGGRFPEMMEKTVEVEVIQKSIAWLEQHPKEQPFLLQVSINGPHTPVVPPYPFDCLYRADEIKYPKEAEGSREGCPKWIENTLRLFADSSRLTPEQISEARRYYYGEVSFVDYQCGVLLNWMKERGLLDNTIVVFVSDHGTHIGDYGLVQKQTFYEPVVNVPFFFWYPSAFVKGITIDTPVETRMLLPTLLDLIGLPIPEQCHAESLADCLLSGEEPKQKPVFSEFTLGTFGVRHDDKIVMVRDGNWKLSVCFAPDMCDGALYDLAKDPYERHNLYNFPIYSEVVSRLTKLIVHHLEREEKGMS